MSLPFAAAVERVKEELQKQIGEEFRNHRILGACNPAFAHKALLAEDKIGVLLPCNVTVQEHVGGRVEVAAEVRAKLKSVIAGLAGS